MKHPFEYHRPTPEQAERMARMNDHFKAAYESLLREAPDSRERALAITKLQEARMWANASVVFEEPA